MTGDLAITNLNFRTTVDEIHHAFGKYGELVMCNLILNERNESKGYAFLTFKRRRDAAVALDELNGYRIYGRPIKIGWVTSPTNAPPTGYNNNNNYYNNSNFNPNNNHNYNSNYGSNSGPNFNSNNNSNSRFNSNNNSNSRFNPNFNPNSNSGFDGNYNNSNSRFNSNY